MRRAKSTRTRAATRTKVRAWIMSTGTITAMETMYREDAKMGMIRLGRTEVCREAEAMLRCGKRIILIGMEAPKTTHTALGLTES
jgi:hypothetical protein